MGTGLVDCFSSLGVSSTGRCDVDGLRALMKVNVVQEGIELSLRPKATRAPLCHDYDRRSGSLESMTMFVQGRVKSLDQGIGWSGSSKSGDGYLPHATSTGE